MLRLRVVALGAGAALAVAFPASLSAQLIDVFADGDDPPIVVYAFVPVILAAMALGGWVVGRRPGPRPVPHGALAGLVAISVVLGLGVVRQLVADEEAAWSSVPVFLGLGGGLGAAGAAAGRRAQLRAARTRR